MLLNNFPSEKRLISIFTIFSFVTAIWVIYGLHGGVDEDGVFYLEIAKRFAAGDYHGGLELYNWAFFPWLISVAHQVTGLSLQYSAHFLEVMFFSAATWALLTLIHEGGGTKLTICMGALLLFSSEYVAGHVLTWIMRDQGFWAFYLLGLLYFFRFYQAGKSSDAALWQLMLIIATLFRVEAMCFLLLLPISLLLKKKLPWDLRIRQLFQAYSMTLLAVFGIAFALLFDFKYLDALGRISELYERTVAAYYQITIGLSQKAEIFGNEILNTYTNDYAIYGIWLTLIVIVAGKLVSASGVLTTVLAAFGLRDEKIHPQLRIIFFWSAAINLLSVTMAMLSTFVIMGRHLIGLTFILIIFAAFSLAGFIRMISQVKFAQLDLRYKTIAYIMLALLVNSLYKNYTFDPSHDYRQEAVSWVIQHKKLDEKVFYSDARLRYYANEAWSGREKDWSLYIDKINNRVPPYQYLVLAISGETAVHQIQLIKNLRNYRIVKKCSNSGKSFAAILKYHHP